MVVELGGPTPQLINELVARVGELSAIRWHGAWSLAVQVGCKQPSLPRASKSLQTVNPSLHK